jgi:hypothetical protein
MISEAASIHRRETNLRPKMTRGNHDQAATAMYQNTEPGKRDSEVNPDNVDFK